MPRRSSSSCGRLGQTGLAIGGGTYPRRRLYRAGDRSGMVAAPIAVICIGLGFYMLHNTLQTNATQMTPRSARHRGRDVFVGALYRTNRRCRTGAPGDRPVWRGAAVSRQRHRIAGAGDLVCARTQALIGSATA